MSQGSQSAKIVPSIAQEGVEAGGSPYVRKLKIRETISDRISMGSPGDLRGAKAELTETTKRAPAVQDDVDMEFGCSVNVDSWRGL